jgi:tetratricopeptide (TPR) repeat protein
MWIKRIFLTFIVSGLMILAGCSQNAVKETDAEQSVKPQVVLAEADKKIYRQALVALKNNKLPDAEKVLDQLIKKYPEASGPLANKGILLVRQNKPDEAELMFIEALKYNPKLVQAMNHLAVLYRKKGKFTEARELFDAAIATDPYYNVAYYNLGILYEIYLQNPEKALENYRLYLDLKKGEDKEVSQWVSLLQRQISQAR